MRKRLIEFITDAVIGDYGNKDENEIKTDTGFGSAERGSFLPVPEARKSLVDVYFPHRNMTLTYYNDKFDLHEGDYVFVDGKLEGHRGRVVYVNYSFRIRLSDYKRVIAVADTAVMGDFYIAGSHVVTFDPYAMPYEKILPWFKAPEPGDDDEIAVGDERSCFALEDLFEQDIAPQVFERGKQYYINNRVLYLSVDHTHGRALVEGTKIYELTFDFDGEVISDLTCPCYCNYFCKHDVAAMLQLRETVDIIKEKYSFEYNDYFAAMFGVAFVGLTSRENTVGKITLC